MTKEQILRQMADLERQNQIYLLTLIQIQTSPSWDGKTIRTHIQKKLTEIIAVRPTEIEVPKRKRRIVQELELPE